MLFQFIAHHWRYLRARFRSELTGALWCFGAFVAATELLIPLMTVFTVPAPQYYLAWLPVYALYGLGFWAYIKARIWEERQLHIIRRQGGLKHQAYVDN